MPDNLYEILALAMRYWFTALGGLIVWRAFSWLRKDRRLKHKRLRTLPDAGMIGEFVVIEGSRDLPEETLISVPYEGVLGFLRACDVVVPVSGVTNEHADFVFLSGKGLRVFPRRGCPCRIDGYDIASRRDAKRHPMGHNSVIEIGEAVLRLRLFAGLDAPYHAALDEDEPIFSPPCSDDEDAVTSPEAPRNPYPPHSPYAPQPDPQGYAPAWQQPYVPPAPPQSAPYQAGSGYPQQPAPYQAAPYTASYRPPYASQNPAPYQADYRGYPEFDADPQAASYPPRQPYSQPDGPWQPYTESPVTQESPAPRANRRRRYDDDE